MSWSLSFILLLIKIDPSKFFINWHVLLNMFFIKFKHLFSDLAFFGELVISLVWLTCPIFETKVRESIFWSLSYSWRVVLVTDDIMWDQTYLAWEDVKVCFIMIKFPPWLWCLLIFSIITILWVAKVFDFYFARCFICWTKRCA